MEKIPEKLNELSHKGGEIAITTATQLIDIGELKGFEKGKIEDAKKMLSKGYSITDISDITELTVEKIQKIKDEL